MIYILTACMIMLVIAAILVTIRTVRGPTSLDRMVSVDMVSSILIGAVALSGSLIAWAKLDGRMNGVIRLPAQLLINAVLFLGSLALGAADLGTGLGHLDLHQAPTF